VGALRQNLNAALAIVWKDILHELRTKEVALSVLVFSLGVIVLFHFAFQAEGETIETIASGILWVTFAFAGVLSQNRSFALEKDQGCLDGLMLCPVDREVIYFGKMLSSFLHMLFIEIIVLPVFLVLFDVSLGVVPQVFAIALLATIGFAAVGTLFSAMAANTKARDIMLPILFYPIIIPVLIMAVTATGEVFDGGSWSSVSSCLGALLAFDVVFLTIAVLVFGYVLEE
jgi:heme exporter protein B